MPPNEWKNSAASILKTAKLILLIFIEELPICRQQHMLKLSTYKTQWLQPFVEL